jgi:hypothetical protein
MNRLQREGVFHEAFNPPAIAISLGASLVTRAFAGDVAQSKKIVKMATFHEGYALVDILQPCVTYNKLNTHNMTPISGLHRSQAAAKKAGMPMVDAQDLPAFPIHVLTTGRIAAFIPGAFPPIVKAAIHFLFSID